jgi:long-chain acyl-CoA synthetase
LRLTAASEINIKTFRTRNDLRPGGSDIYPSGGEEVLLLHPKVLEVSIIGRKHADWGEEVVAYVVPRDGTRIDKSEFGQLCLDRIARFKRPKEYFFIEALPKNDYGKVLKTELGSRLN